MTPTVEGVPKESAEVVPASEVVSQGGTEVLPAEKGISGDGAEVFPGGKGTSKYRAKTKAISAAPRSRKTVASGGIILKEATGKRTPLVEVPLVALAPKKACVSKQLAPVLPPVEKKKAFMELLSSASNNEVLNADEITPQSTTTTVVELLRKRMFGGVTDASDPCLLALTILLAYSTREQTIFTLRLGRS